MAHSVRTVSQQKNVFGIFGIVRETPTKIQVIFNIVFLYAPQKSYNARALRHVVLALRLGGRLGSRRPEPIESDLIPLGRGLKSPKPPLAA